MPTTTETQADRGLAVRGIVKRFAGVTVLRGVSVVVRPGEVVGLVGHNGAGKSTLLRTISGAIRPDGGEIRVDGAAKSFTSPADAHAAGIGAVYQELSLLPNLTVMQNAFLGTERSKGGILRRAEMRAETARIAESFGLDVDPERKVADYPVATRQLLEIAIVTSHNARYLLLDEPTTSLEGHRVDHFLEQVRGLAQSGLGIILVDHKLDELYAVADRVVALVDGELRIDAKVSEVPRAEVVRAIAGADLDVERAQSQHGTEPKPRTSKPTVDVQNLITPDLHGLSLQAHPGRVLGLYGLVGSGRTEFLRALSGLDRVITGDVRIDGQPYRPKNPRRARKAGIVYVTEERKSDGIVPQLDSTVNIMLPVLEQFTRLGFLNGAAIDEKADELMDRFAVRGNRGAPVVRLSGGNQQKIVLALSLIHI